MTAVAQVRGQLETLQAQHCTETQEHQLLLTRYTDLRTRMGTLSTTLDGLKDQAKAAVNEHEAPVMGATA